MGSYGKLLVGRYLVGSFYGGVPQEVLTLFQDGERLHLHGNEDYSDTRHGLCDRLFDLTTEDYSDEAEYICYSASVGELRDRLDVLGFTRREAVAVFDLSESKRATMWLETVRQSVRPTPNWLQEQSVQKTFNDWIQACRELPPMLTGGSVVSFDSIEHAIGWPRTVWTDDDEDIDVIWLTRALLEVCDEDDLVALEITDLIDAGYYDEDDNELCTRAWSLATTSPSDRRIVVLTEGSTDQQVLESALDVLYPHLTGFIVFFDFAVSNAQGGAANLFSLVRGFAGAGISNRIVALFDNDSAASDVLRGLDRTKLPKNIRVIQYPPLDLATNYPTLGPSGLAEMDVNGLAGSIELYLGRDVLEESGQLHPVQWRGYVQGVNKYQGELINKRQALAAFARKVRMARENEEVLRLLDWSGVRAIFKALITAFD
jgi:hypothetical protein